MNGVTTVMGISTFHLRFINQMQKAKVEVVLVRIGFNPNNTILNPGMTGFNPEKYL